MQSNTEDERSSGSRSLESGTSGSSGGVHGGGGDELGPGEWTSSSDLAGSPPLQGAGNQSLQVSEEETSTFHHAHAQRHDTPQSVHTSHQSGHSSEEDISTTNSASAYQSTHPAHKRPYELVDEDDPLDVATTSSPVSPKETHTWVKRPRFGEIPDFRTAKNGRKITLELKLRKFGNRNSDEIVVPERGMEFDSLPEAFDFFNLYSWEVGFGIKYGASRRNKQGSLTMQEILCGCAGSPRHDKTKSSASKCKAMIRLRRTDDHVWYIHVFRKVHNHSMSVSCGEKMHWTSHKNIDPHTKALVRNLRDNNVGLSQVYMFVGRYSLIMIVYGDSMVYRVYHLLNTQGTA